MMMTGGNKLSSNPWSSKLEALPSVIGKDMFSSDDIIYRLSKILDNWHGTATPSLKSKERQNRLIKTISGYPDIDIGTRPFDWNSHPDSIFALRTSLAIDNFKGIDPQTSLRSELLNLDINRRYEIKKNKENDDASSWTSLSSQCIALLFTGIAPSPRAQESLLASVFSYDNTIGLDGGWKETLDEYEKIKDIKMPEKFHTLSPDEPENVDYETIKKINMGNDNVREIDREIYNKHKSWKNELKRNNEYMIFSFPKENEWEVEFKFYRIQNWMNELLKYDESKGTAQRIIRGASLILESVISEIRDVAINSYGPGSILIDGGGRLLISVKDENSAKELRDEIISHDKCLGCNNIKESRYYSFLAVPNPSALRLERELTLWFEKILLSDTNINSPDKGKNCEICGLKIGNSPGYLKREKIRNFAESGLPPRRVHIRKKNLVKEEINSVKSLINALNIWGEPPVKSNNSNTEECPFINPQINSESDWNKVEGWMKSSNLESQEKYKLNVNDTHRLLYIIGKHQRIKDSLLNRPTQENNKPNINFFSILTDKGPLGGKESFNRPCISIAKIDGNIMGAIFSLEKNENYYLDSTRRRSFRFNSHWWDSLFTSMKKTNLVAGDPIAQWAAAGDDVLLGHYYNSETQDKKPLFNYLKKLSEEIQNLINVELRNAKGNKNNLTFSFSGGYLQRGDNNLRTMINKVNILEKIAKDSWKFNMTNNHPNIIPSKKQISPPYSPIKESIDIKFNNSILEGFEDNLYPSKQLKSNTTVEIEWPTLWEEKILRESISKLELQDIEKESKFGDIFEILTRCETETSRIKDEKLVTKIILKNKS